MGKQYVFLLKQLVVKDLRTRYTGSTFGFLWAFAQPLLQLLLFTFVFATILKIPLTGERGIDSFPLFLFAGLLPWMAMQETLTRATTSIQDNAPMVQKAVFPPALLVWSILVSAILHEGFALAAFMGVLLILGKGSFAWPALLLVVPVQMVLTFGLSLLLASIHVFFRDTIQFVNYLTMVWFYFTPIVYPLSLVQGGVDRGRMPSWIMDLLRWNPLTILVEAYRDVLLRGTLPRLDHLGVLTLIGIGVSWGALALYRKLRPHFADVV